VDRERLKRIRNWQSSEFYARLVMRPLSIVIMLVVADWRWLTPNLVTTLANVAKLVGAALILLGHREHALSAALVLQLGLLLDHLDGTIARYRKCGTALGAFYDKVSDAVTWGAIMAAIGYVAYRDSGDVWLPICAVGSAYALLVLGYMKWIVAAATTLARRTPVQAPSLEPPTRTPRQWALWFASSVARVVLFEEVDLFFWIGVALLVDRLDLLIWLLAITQGAQLVIMLVKRGLEARRLDVEPARDAGTQARSTQR
jgi:phosphatidylglycerophosphate synthase